MSTIEEIGMGKAIQFDFYAKHNAAADLAPISGSFTLSPKTKEQQQRFAKPHRLWNTFERVSRANQIQ